MSKENQSKKIGMSSGTHRNDFFVSLFIDQKPVRFHVQFPITSPIALKRMITQLIRQSLFTDKGLKDALQFSNVLPAFLHQIQILIKKPGRSKAEHYLPRFLKYEDTLSWYVTSPFSVACIARIVSWFGTSIEKGIFFSLTNLRREMRKKSEKFKPMELKSSEASFLSSLLTRIRIESLLAVVGIFDLRYNNVATHYKGR